MAETDRVNIIPESMLAINIVTQRAAEIGAGPVVLVCIGDDEGLNRYIQVGSASWMVAFGLLKVTHSIEAFLHNRHMAPSNQISRPEINQLRAFYDEKRLFEGPLAMPVGIWRQALVIPSSDPGIWVPKDCLIGNGWGLEQLGGLKLDPMIDQLAGFEGRQTTRG